MSEIQVCQDTATNYFDDSNSKAWKAYCQNHSIQLLKSIKEVVFLRDELKYLVS